MPLSNAERARNYRMKKKREEARIKTGGFANPEEALLGPIDEVTGLPMPPPPMAPAPTPVSNAILAAQKRREASQPPAVTTSGETDEEDEDAPPTVTLAVPESAKPPSIRDRLFGKRKAAAPPPFVGKARPTGRSATRQKKSVNLVSSTLPTIIAGLIATYVGELLPEEYKACAPSRLEALAVLGPLFEIIGRRVEVVSKASEDAIDAVNSFLAAVAYGARCYVTVVQIRRAKEKYEKQQAGAHSGAADDTRAARAGSLFGGYRAEQNNGTDRVVSGGPQVGGGYPDPTAGDAGVGGAADSNGDTGDSLSDAEKVAAMFKRDFAGRQQLGLVRVPIQ